MKSGKMLLGLLSGAAAGAALGMLFAPKKGADTRRTISKTSDGFLEGAKGKFNEFSNSINHKVEAIKAKSKASVTGSKTKEKINEAKADIHEMKSS